jgi:hypothetical protein
MKLFLEGLFVAVVLVLELVGVVVLGRSTLATETYPLASRGATPVTYIIATHDHEDGGSYWVEWETPSCGLLGVPGDGDTEHFQVSHSGKEVVGIGEAAGCRAHLRPHAATTRQPGVSPSGGHRADPASEKSPSEQLNE